jgi:GNAT superfamily N-acetyltransferase
MSADLLELAEEPGLWIPLAPPSEVLHRDGYSIVTSLRTATVERVRLLPDAIEWTVEEIRRFARERGFDHVTWWLGDRTLPYGLGDRLTALGLTPDPYVPEMTSFTIDRQPVGGATVEVRRVASADEYLGALELDWEVWNVPDDERESLRPIQREAWPLIEESGRASHYVAYLDGEPAGFARAVFTPAAAILMGGSVLPAARSRGVYTSLVHARWDDAVERGTPRIVVSAGAMSAPILERLGFEPIGNVVLLRDAL